jgi:hypothetical protein
MFAIPAIEARLDEAERRLGRIEELIESHSDTLKALELRLTQVDDLTHSYWEILKKEIYSIALQLPPPNPADGQSS